MSSYNRVVLMGHLTRDPQLRQIASGVSVADLGLATNERFKNRDGEAVEKACFVDVVAWNRQAETCGRYLSKGAPVLVEGRLQFDRWETAEGQTRTKLRVRADRVTFLGRREAAETPATAAADAAAADGHDDLPF